MEGTGKATRADAMGLINLITTAARNAITHKNNCQQLADHVRMIGNLLEKLKSTDLMKLAATAEPLAQLEEALKKALDLVENCRDKSYLYMISLGWNVVYQFRQVQDEIDRYLKLVPLISLVHEFRLQNVKESLEAIEEDHKEYTLDEEDVEAQNVILKPDRSKKDASVLEKSLSRRYPDLQIHEALQEEKDKLLFELHRLRENNDPKQYRVIEHLIDVTENVVNVPALALNLQPYIEPGETSDPRWESTKLRTDADGSEWQADLFECCSEPCLSMKACIYPCGIFSRIANVVSCGKITREEALNNLMAYSLFCGCCCYTCCIRGKVRKLFGIEGGSCDDFLTHLMCCCCALVQEWRELELRDFEGCQRRKNIAPPYQCMNP
ncbi:protein MID1-COMPLEMENTING ACTIVITY 1-like isoform X1 [Coffea eugenioides]|uniref:Protein MID1-COMPLEMENTING ACTIVITY 1-like isoform X1 n=1 Tax=Coffea arabica TaxID=13443 RepID=A0ABM4WRQ4_COFAR|nr:protein MID1-COMPLEMENTING ACTIVITY 1-like isoform X1 [Coffea eugenioides]XP_027162880.1 protein MID1-COMPLEMENTING ACTIVITY 1-like isoform X1 [Coffea eugenioides]